MTSAHVAPYLRGDGICPDPIFVIGSPRSGTTALAQSLNRHPDLRVGKESYILHDLFQGERAEQVWERQMHRVTPCWLAHEEVEQDEFLAFLGLGLNALFSSRAEGKRWIDQTPLYTPMAGTLARMFPGAKFIHIVRDGRHVVRSMVNFERKFDQQAIQAAQRNEIPKWSNDFRHGCQTWSTWVDAGLDFGVGHRDRCLDVWNEPLSADPATGFAAILEFLGVPHHPGPGNFFGKQRINSSWVRDPTRPEDDDWTGWSRKRRQEFVKVAGGTMTRAGYGTEAALQEWAKGDT
jgi:hypothetical protein